MKGSWRVSRPNYGQLSNVTPTRNWSAMFDPYSSYTILLKRFRALSILVFLHVRLMSSNKNETLTNGSMSSKIVCHSSIGRLLSHCTSLHPCTCQYNSPFCSAHHMKLLFPPHYTSRSSVLSRHFHIMSLYPTRNDVLIQEIQHKTQ